MSRKQIILGVVAVLVVVFGGRFVYEHLTYVSTDDAQVAAHVTMLSSRVPGTIQKVLVEENEKVKAGQVLAQIDVSDLSNSATAAQAEVASLQARVREAEANFRRAQDLFRKQAVPRERLDNATAQFKDLTAKLKQAEAQAQEADLNVNYTKILAPTDGTVARKSVEVGQFVPAGQPLFGFVEGNERWVSANFKETEIPDLKIGRVADISVDAIPGRTFKGEVLSIAPATGALFSLLPPDNATGNYTKVVQRVPVRITLKELSGDDIDRLQAGLSADVSVRVR